MQRIYVLTLLLLIGLGILLPTKIEAQKGSQLPTDLLFSVPVDSNSYSSFSTLVRVDAETLQTAPFFTDITSSNLSAISWSPQGQFLAVFRNTGAEMIELCIINQSGQMQTCFDDGISQYAFGDLAENYEVTWSADEQQVYFIVENNRILSLVEGDVQTGNTLRTIYQSPNAYGEAPLLIHWTPELDYIASYQINQPYISDYADMIEIRPVTIIDLQTDERTTLGTYNAGLGYLYYCESFSPLGNYLVARAYNDERLPNYVASNPALSAMIIVNKEGYIVHIIDYNQLAQYGFEWAHCPTWQEQEEAFYFLAGSWNVDQTGIDKSSIVKYSLAQNELTELQQIGSEVNSETPVGPLILSPDDTAIAFRFREATGINKVAIWLQPDQIIRFDEHFFQSAQPIWLPSVDSFEPPVANAGPDQTVTASTNGTALVALDGSGSSDSDGTIVAYRWYENDMLIAEGITPQVELGVGEHTITLTVEDDDGAIDSDDVIITVTAGNLPFTDTFYTPYNWEATGRWSWVHSSTNDYPCYAYMLNMRNTSAAYLDTLTELPALHLTGATTPVLFYKTIYALGANEYARVQVSTDEGQTWITIQEFTNASAGNWGTPIFPITWAEHQVDLSAYIDQTIRLRFELDMPVIPRPQWAQKWALDDIQVTADGVPLQLSQRPCWEELQ